MKVETIDGSAVEGEDYQAVDKVTIVDDHQWEPDEEFFLKVSLLSGDENGEVKLGWTCIMEITILNDDSKHLQVTTLRQIAYFSENKIIEMRVGFYITW